MCDDDNNNNNGNNDDNRLTIAKSQSPENILRSFSLIALIIIYLIIYLSLKLFGLLLLLIKMMIKKRRYIQKVCLCVHKKKHKNKEREHIFKVKKYIHSL